MTLEDIVRSKVVFKSFSQNSWNKTYCEVCGDGKRTKGPRGGWLFSSDGIFYHCFNCGINGNYAENREHPFSKDMHTILESFGIQKSEYIHLYLKDAANKESTIKKHIIPIKFIDIPQYFYKLSEAAEDNPIAISAKEFLNKKYGLNSSVHPFYLSSGIGNDPAESSLAKSLMNRIIIPFFRNDKMVYYQARSLENQPKIKYINANAPKSNVIFNYDNLFKNLDSPLYVFESVFDALHVNGVAVLENTMTTQQIEMLQKSPRNKVVVPDRFGDSNKLMEQAISLKWDICLPELGSGNKDISEAIVKYGKLFVINSMTSNIYNYKQAEVLGKMFCK
jgi:hypothetical protein